MGLFDRFFGGGGPQHPPLEPGSDPASRLGPFEEQLASMAAKVRDSLEAVPKRDELYVLVGHPPKGFGVVRIAPGHEENLIQLMREKGLAPGRVQAVSDQARAAYIEHQEAPRFTHRLGPRAITVIDSERLGEKLGEVFEAVQG